MTNNCLEKKFNIIYYIIYIFILYIQSYETRILGEQLLMYILTNNKFIYNYQVKSYDIIIKIVNNI